MILIGTLRFKKGEVKKKKSSKMDLLILTKLLIFYRTSVALARCRKIHVFSKGKSAGAVLSVQWRLNFLNTQLQVVTYSELTYSCSKSLFQKFQGVC